MKFIFSFIALCFVSIVFSQKVSYTLRMPKPQNHYFEVEMLVSGVKDKTLEVKMPVWAPGSYLVREFAKNVNLVKAFDEKGKPLKVDKTSKNAWVIDKSNAKDVVIKYEVYAFELSVRTSFLDLSHGFVSGTGVFMYVDALKNISGELAIFPYETFKKITTSLPKSASSSKGFNYQFSNYDQLVDCPIEIGNQEVFDFMAAGVKHTVSMYGQGNYDVATLKKDMTIVVEEATKVIGENPNKEYTFIIHNVVDGQGGLEHTNSTTLSVNRWTYQGEDYTGFLSLVAHEYFHLWNVKRIRPIELGPFNYDQENYTTLLWVMEGFTSYYDELLLKRSGYITKDQMLQKINSGINYVEGTEGSRVQPVAHSSFDAWIKGYRPNENSSNTGMTYYSRGGMLAALLDAKIITKYDGKKCLDDFLRVLYDTYYIKFGRGFTEEEFKKTLEDFIGESMDIFYADYINGTKTPDFNKFFNPLGVKADYLGVKKPSFGAGYNGSVIKSIRVNSAAELAGLSVNDEVIGINGFRVAASEIEPIISGLKEDEQIDILISRDDVLMNINARMGVYERPSYKLSFENKLNALGEYWLR